MPEAGGLFSGGKDAFKQGIQIGDAIMSRRYVFMRAVQGTEVDRMRRTSLYRGLMRQTEKPKDIQHRLVAEMYDTVTEWTNSDM